jgi:Family of unknown function (DUF6496)
VKEAMHEYKEGKLKSGRSGRRMKNSKQAVAIGLSEARSHPKTLFKVIRAQAKCTNIVRGIGM